jgi:hypothetical protein
MGINLEKASQGKESLNLRDLTDVDQIFGNVQQIKFEKMASTKGVEFEIATIPFELKEGYELRPHEFRSRYENWYLIEPILVNLPVHTKKIEDEVEDLFELWRNLIDHVYVNIESNRENKPDGYFSYTKSQNTNRGIFLLFRF